MELEYIVEENNNYTINSILSEKFQISTRLLNKLIKMQKILLNGKICDTRQIPSQNDILKVDFNYSEDNSNIVPTKMDLDIIYEDDWLLVVNKPAGVPIHPSRMHYTNSLSNGIKFYFDSISLAKKIRPVNRLDIGTSGLVIFAKCEYIQECFSRQMSNNIFKKEYICVVSGILKEKSGTINLPISRKDGSIIERCVNKSTGHPSITKYEVLKEFDNYSLVKCYLETGRTHQIRVHMSAIGHPIIGDTLYGNSSNLINRQALHSYKITCIHPIGGTSLIFESKLPDDILQTCPKKGQNGYTRACPRTGHFSFF